MRRRIFLTIPLIILVLAAGVHIPNGESVQGGVDCGFLGVMLANILDKVANNDLLVKDQISTLTGIALPEPLKSVHVKTYDAIASYLEALEYLNGGRHDSNSSEILRKLQDVSSSLRSRVESYLNFIAECIHDKSLLTTVKTISILKTEKILDSTLGLAEIIASGTVYPSPITVSTGKDSYAPGEVVLINASTSKEVMLENAFKIVMWPSLEVVGEGHLIPQENYHLGWFPIPQVSELIGRQVLQAPRDKITLAVIVRGRVNDDAVVGIKFFRLEIGKPKVYLQAPPFIYAGEPLRITISTFERTYNASIIINQTIISRIVLQPGDSAVLINPEQLGNATGVLMITLSVEATNTTLPLNMTATTFVLKKKIPLTVEAQPFSLTITNSFKVRIIVKPDYSGNVRVSINAFNSVKELVLENNTVETEINSPWLPILTSTVKVYAVSDDPIYEPALQEFNIVIVNPLLTVSIGFGLIALSTAFRTTETVFVVYVKTLRSGARKQDNVRTPQSDRAWESKSVIAKVYYAVLSKLSLGLPGISETLREHFHKITLSGGIRSLLEKLLKLAEKDLYARSKPSYEEAVEIANQVLNYEAD